MYMYYVHIYILLYTHQQFLRMTETLWDKCCIKREKKKNIYMYFFFLCLKKKKEFRKRRKKEDIYLIYAGTTSFVIIFTFNIVLFLWTSQSTLIWITTATKVRCTHYNQCHLLHNIDYHYTRLISVC